VEQQGIRELVGRVMIDPDFLAELVRAPATTLADYRLSPEERAAVLQAIHRLDSTPSRRQVQELQAALMKRWAT
jgi:hypothetical protein